ncbi:MAG: nucleoside-diphosphate-sugar pyrophosphorylase [Thermoleophilia bacterium]
MILAAGYATRLYPLTRHRPKPLLHVAGRPIVEHLLDRLAPIEGLNCVYLVTNSKFAAAFAEWARGWPRPVVVVDDGTRDEASRRGAIGDLVLVLDRAEIDDDLVVVAGDNLFSHSLAGFARYSLERAAPVLAVYDVGDLELVKQYNAIEIDDQGRVVYFQEKPDEPRSTLVGIALYFYPRSVLPLVRAYLDGGGNPDQPGRLIEWLYPRLDVYTWRVPGLWFDIGSKEKLEEADRVFSQLSWAGASGTESARASS